MATRREFLATSAMAAGAMVTGRWPAAPMNLLILGGTGFIGPHLVRHAVSRGHKVTIFTRGRADGDLPAGITRLIGDRNGQLGALAGGRWDAVVDDSATNPEWVKQSTALLKDSVGRYLFTSSTGVYYPYLTPKANESVEAHATQVDPKDGDETYGVSKRQCELEVLRVFGNRGVVVRPTYIVGPGDTSDRFPYWAARVPRGGDVLAPGRREDPVQWIDVRDLAAFYIKLLEDQQSGIFNGVATETTVPSRQFYEAVRATINPKANFVYVDDYALLEKHGLVEIVPFVLLTGKNLHATELTTTRSAAAGLRTRPLADTLRDTVAWWPTVPEARRQKPKFVITPEIEARVLAEFKART